MPPMPPSPLLMPPLCHLQSLRSCSALTTRLLCRPPSPPSPLPPYLLHFLQSLRSRGALKLAPYLHPHPHLVLSATYHPYTSILAP
ncbi:hypothetical protein O181_023617 [Austropuccinia psidii MF-1]|uniref:Uncharacterized protein n=1 Tax=Austropuccinia psidii MF-1 TaxID=1389203 RepID=A0A9Q3CJV5_9BASI|nr:hypothetical protein [Austropuccinia psidii MF-1]